VTYNRDFLSSFSPSLAPARGLGHPWLALVLAATFSTAAGCKDKDLPVGAEFGEACEPADEEPCVEGLSCEELVDGSGHVCGGIVELRGMVIDAIEETPIAGARVLALDDTGAPVTNVAVSDADGHYVLEIAVPRDTDGNPATAITMTLSASAHAYQLYPSGLQPAFPVSTDDIQDAEDDPDIDTDDHLSFIENASTTIGLLPLDSADGFTVSGRVGAEEDESGAGTLVTAEGAASVYTIADRSGEFTLFNVPAGANTIRGYRGGLQIVPEVLDDVQENVEGVVLGISTEGLSTVTGSVNIVNPGDGGDTSVVMIPSALFNPVFEFGPVPFALRAPEPGVAPNVSSAFTIADVPAGTYKVIAALENDFLVRDPDTSIAGTDILELTVVAGENVDLQDSFKVTGALGVMSPGADGPEEVTGTPTFIFEDDSSEDGYIVVVHDALGTEIWRDDQVPSVSGGGMVSVPYGGPALTPGMYYRFQATSWKDGNPEPTSISRTEDLRGVFFYAE
jgi:hypothetical protein